MLSIKFDHLFIYIIFIISLDLCSYACANSEEFTFCTPNTEEQVVYKVSHRVLKEAFNRLGHNFNLITVPAKRCPVEVNRGFVDGDSHRIFGFNNKNEYPNLIRIEEIVQTIDQSVFSKNPDIDPSELENLKHYRIIYMDGIKIIENVLRKANVSVENKFPVFSHERAFKMLLLDRGDLIIVNSNTGKHFLKKMKLKNSGIRLLKPPLISFDLYPYIHKKHSKLAKQLANELKKMKKEGVYDLIVESAME